MRNPDNTARNPKQGSKRANRRPTSWYEASLEAQARTASLEAKRLARRTDSPARSANVEAANATRVLEIVAYIARMKSPEAAPIAQALRSERPAVRRAVMNRLDTATRKAA